MKIKVYKEFLSQLVFLFLEVQGFLLFKLFGFGERKAKLHVYGSIFVGEEYVYNLWFDQTARDSCLLLVSFV